MKSKLFATAAAVLAATIGLVALLCLMGQAGSSALRAQPALAAPRQAPTVTAVDPASAPNDLDTPIVLTGTGFTAGMTVTLGNTRLPDATWVSSTTLTATVPWGLDAGVYTLTVTNPDDQSGSLPNAFTVTQGIGVWTTGGPYGGKIRGIAINPLTPAVVYATVTAVGLFRSRDSGQTWEMIHTAGYAPAEIDPSSPDTIYISEWSGEVYRSDDGGDTWVNVLDLPNGEVRIFAHPTISGTVYVGTSDYGSSEPYAGNLLKSTNRGQTWVPLTNGLTNTQVTALAIDSTDPLTMYVATGRISESDGNVFRSVNGGESWELVGQTGRAIGQLGINPFTRELWACGTGGGSGDLALLKQNPISWTEVLPKPVYAFAFSRNVSGTMWVGTWGRHLKSTDGGLNWLKFGAFSGSVNIPALAVDPTNEQVVYHGYSDRGIYKTMDDGATWQEANQGLAGLNPVRLVAVPGEPSTVYVASSDRRSFKTENGGGSWRQLPSDICSPMAADPVTRTRIYGAAGGSCPRSVIRISQDDGLSWHEVPVPLPPRYATCCEIEIQSLLANPAQPGHLVMGAGYLDKNAPYYTLIAGGIYTSADFGETWNHVDVGREISPVTVLAHDPSNPAILYAGTTGNPSVIGTAVLKSADGGNTWQYSRAGLETWQGVESITVEPVAPHRVFANRDSEIRVSTDGGTIWTLVQPPSDQNLEQILFEPSKTPALYAAAEHGLYRSWDSAQSWQRMDGALGYANVRVLAIVTSTNRTIIYAGVPGAVETEEGMTLRAQATLAEIPLAAGVYRYTSRVVGLQNGSLSGPTTGLVQRAYTFTATISPPNATLPIAYEWQSTDQPLIDHASGLSDTVVLTWTTPGVKVIAVTANNDSGAHVVSIHTITIEQHHVYLPVVLRGG